MKASIKANPNKSDGQTNIDNIISSIKAIRYGRTYKWTETIETRRFYLKALKYQKHTQRQTTD